MISFRNTFEESFVRTLPYGNILLIAPYWSDKPGDVLYRISNNQTLLDKVSSHIADAFSEISPTMLFIATWNRVPQSSSENNTLFNTFQAVIATDNNANATVVLFLYRDIQLSSDLTIIGFNSDSNSHTESMNNINDTNIGQPGVFAFQVDQENIQLPKIMGCTYVCTIPHISYN